jgi:hypothetical protein
VDVRYQHLASISPFHRAFQFTIYNGSTNALVCNKTLIQMSHIKTFKITPTCFDHQMIIIRELFDVITSLVSLEHGVYSWENVTSE